VCFKLYMMTESLQSRHTVLWRRDCRTAAPDITVVVLILSKSGKFILVRHLTLAFFTYQARSGCRSPQLPFYLTCTLLAFQALFKSCAATPLSVVLNRNFIVYAIIELCLTLHTTQPVRSFGSVRFFMFLKALLLTKAAII